MAEQLPPTAPLRKKHPLLLGIGLILLLAFFFFMLWSFRSGQPTGRVHYLLLGKDGWGKVSNNGRTDTMLLCTLNYDKNEILLTSFLRDTQVDFPGGGKNRLNTLFSRPGARDLQDYIAQHYGAEIAGTIAVNFTSMVQLVDALEGITLPLTGAEARYINRTEGVYPDHPLQAGDCRLNGAQALCYMRCRALDSDIGRTDRQATAMAAMFSSLKRMGTSQAIALLSALSGSYETDLSFPSQIGLIKDAFTLRNAKVRHYQIPAKGTFRYSNNSMLIVNIEKNRDLWEKVLSGDDSHTGE